MFQNKISSINLKNRSFKQKYKISSLSIRVFVCYQLKISKFSLKEKNKQSLEASLFEKKASEQFWKVSKKVKAGKKI